MPRGVPMRICEKCKRRYQEGDVDNHTALWTLHFDEERRLSFWLCWRSTCRAVGGDRVRRAKLVDGVEVDRKIRAALARVEPGGSNLSAYEDLVALGIPGLMAWGMISGRLFTLGHRELAR